MLVDSIAIVRDAFAATAAHCRFSFADHDFQRVKGLWLLEAYRRLDPGSDASVRREFHLGYVRERIGEIRAYPTVAETLAEAKAKGVRVAAATSHGEIAESCLVNTGLYRYIDCLVTQEEVKRPKPHPDSIVLVLALIYRDRHPVESEWVAHVGDSPFDIEAGRAAGVHTVGVTYGVSEEAELRAAAPDYVIHSFGEMRMFLTDPVCQSPVEHEIT